jgi:hypothetical protein
VENLLIDQLGRFENLFRHHGARTVRRVADEESAQYR